MEARWPRLTPRPFFSPFLTKCRKSAIGILVFLSVTGVTVAGRWLLASSAEARKIKPADAPPVSVRVVEVRDEVVASGVRYSAVVKELNKAELSFRVGGTVEFLHQVEGPGGKARPDPRRRHAQPGQVIARLDPADFRRDRDATASTPGNARAKLAEAKADAELAKSRVPPRRTAHRPQRAEQVRRRLCPYQAARDFRGPDAAQSEVETAQIELAKAEANLEYCTLKVPFERAPVAARYVERDERVAAGQKAFLIVDVSSVVIAFMVPDTLVSQLAIGQSMDVTCDALPVRHFTGVIHKVAATADPLTRSYPIEVRIDQPDGLRPGMVANVHIRKEQRAPLASLDRHRTGHAPAEALRGLPGRFAERQ